MRLPDVDVKDLALAVTVAETGRLTEAAGHLGLSLSAVSHRLSGLESRLDTALFVRGRDGMRLTQAGALFVRHARVALEAAKRAEQVAGQPGEEMRVGSAWLMATTVLPAVLWGLVPRGWVDVRTGRSQDVMAWVENQEVDVGLVRASESRPGVALRPVGRDPVVLAVPAGHRWIEEPPQAAELSASPLITISERTGYGRFLRGALRPLGVTLMPGLMVDHLEAALALVAAGLAPSLLPLSLVLRARSGAVAAVELPSLTLPARTLALAWPEGRDLPSWARDWPERLGHWLGRDGHRVREPDDPGSH
jgi:DNA-binding transcriptional LysR family regulator